VTADDPTGRTLDAFKHDIEGTVIQPSDAAYDEARRVWNGLIDRRPVAIVRAGRVDDVAPTIRLARELELSLAVRGGGHNVAGNGTVEGGIVLDLGGLNSVEVDPVAGTVSVGPGATLGDLDRATEPHGLVVPSGVISGTGIAGLTLGGGVGWLTRAHGLTADSLVAADLVTAAGELVRASATENDDLLWGLKGGGGNFGVVTSFTFRTFALPTDIFTGTLIYGPDQWTTALQAYAAWSAELPDPLTSIATFMVPRPDWDLGADPLILLGWSWASPDRAEGERLVHQLRAAAPPMVAVVDPVAWTTWQSAADGLFPKGSRAYWKNTSFDRLDAATIQTLVRYAREQTWIGTGFDVHHMGGAFGRVPEDATPFPNRSAGYWLNIYGFWSDPADDPARTAWIRGFAPSMEPHATGGQYVNFLGQERGRDSYQAALSVYGPAKLERLTALKRRYDPDNVFRLNHNVPPG
jgi:FAD/FMN-containing dehydrogenase